MPQRIGSLGLDPLAIGVGDPDEDLLAPRRGALQVLDVAVVKGLEPPVDHAAGDHSTATPAPSSTRPTRRMKSLRDSNSACSAGARSAATETSRPPAVCGSYPSATSVSGTSGPSSTCGAAKSRLRGSPLVRTPWRARSSAPSIA